MRIIGETINPCYGRLIRVMQPNGLGGEYEEHYRPDGSWPFNRLGNFDLPEPLMPAPAKCALP